MGRIHEVNDFGLRLAQTVRGDRKREVRMFGLPMEVVVGAGLLVLVLLMVMIVVARMYRKAGPHEALIVNGMDGTHAFTGKGAIIFPIVQTCKALPLHLMLCDLAP